jgi:hypothetical protein
MYESFKERYASYPKTKERKRVRFKEGRFLQRTYEWLKWKITRVGGFAYHTPYLKQ